MALQIISWSGIMMIIKTHKIQLHQAGLDASGFINFFFGIYFYFCEASFILLGAVASFSSSNSLMEY
jgi:hypothetical protein